MAVVKPSASSVRRSPLSEREDAIDEDDVDDTLDDADEADDLSEH